MKGDQEYKTNINGKPTGQTIIINNTINHCKKTLTRKKLLYKTDVEYGDWAINHVLGCPHGCKYPCYAFNIMRKYGIVKNYDEWIKPNLVINTLEILDKEIPKYKDKIKNVHLCFTTDPYPYLYNEYISGIHNMSNEIIKKLNKNNIPVTVLTKGILPIWSKVRDNMNHPDNMWGITLVSMDNHEYHDKWEPFTSRSDERISSLYLLHKAGFKTWVSMEPYPTPNIVVQNINDILENIKFVNKIIFGKLRYNKLVTEYKSYQDFYDLHAQIIIEYCEENKIECIIKKGTMSKSIENKYKEYIKGVKNE
jgi:DNA repair photolyase